MKSRKFARAAALGALGGSAVTALTAGGVVFAQLVAAKRRPAVDPRSAPELAAKVGPLDGDELRVVILGDSIASGVGTHEHARDAAGLLLAMLAERGYRVEARSVAVPNSLATDVKLQSSRALITSERDPYDLAIIISGTMDVCDWTDPTEVERTTYRTVASLTNRGIRVILATTLDLGTAPCVRRPLRSLWGWQSRRVAAAQRRGSERGGAILVDLVAATSTSFAGDHGLYAEDGFHPSADGYRAIADAIAPSVVQIAREKHPA